MAPPVWVFFRHHPNFVLSQFHTLDRPVVDLLTLFAPDVLGAFWFSKNFVSLFYTLDNFFLVFFA